MLRSRRKKKLPVSSAVESVCCAGCTGKLVIKVSTVIHKKLCFLSIHSKKSNFSLGPRGINSVQQQGPLPLR